MVNCVDAMTQAPQVVVAIQELFFLEKVRAAAESLGVSIRLVAHGAELRAMAKQRATRLVLVDLNDDAFSPIESIAALKEGDPSWRVIGFLGHEQVDLARAAHEAGCDLVLNRRQFSARMGELLSGGGVSGGATASRMGNAAEGEGCFGDPAAG